MSDSNIADLPLVSVVCLTYNHEKYITQALEGFITQKTSFPFEVIIHDDASTDGTTKIIKEYQQKYSNIIKVITQIENQYSTGKSVPAIAFAHAQGLFIAYCEGDDYWTDPLKLQRQADYLMKNPEVGLVFTDADYYYEKDGRIIHEYDRLTRKNIPVGDVRKSLLIGNPYKSCTSMFRAKLVTGYEKIALQLQSRMEDNIMWMIIAENSKVEYLNYSTAIYRIRQQSASHFTDFDKFLRFHKSNYKIRYYFNLRYGSLVDKQQIRASYQASIVEHCLQHQMYMKALKYAGSVHKFLYFFIKIKLRSLLLNSDNILSRLTMKWIFVIQKLGHQRR